MVSTFNGCYRSEIKVTPKNWNTQKASVKSPWRIHYRFYDPAFKDHPKFKKGKQVPIKGMNHVDTLRERQDITKSLIADEMREIDKLGYNPITKVYMAPVEAKEEAFGIVTLDTRLIIALEWTLQNCISREVINLMKTDGYAFYRQNNINVVYKDGQLLSDNLQNPLLAEQVIQDYMKEKELSAEIEPETVNDIKSMLKYFAQSAVMLKKDITPLGDIKSRDIESILHNCKNLTVTKIVNKKVFVEGKWKVVTVKQNGKQVPVKIEVTRPKIWSENQFNHYRKYLHILFERIKKTEVFHYNLIDNIDIKDTAPEDPDLAKRKVLTPEERRKIHISLIIRFPEFLRVINIFYHSGGRRKEIMKVQGKHVDLVGQRYKVLVKKGKKRWVWKTIKDVALPYWKEAVQNCEPEDYVFSVGLVPGPKPVRPEQVTRRWREHIKKKLGIKSRFYDLKHLHTTEVINELEKLKSEIDPVLLAAEHNSHTSTAMVVNIYDVDNDKRQHKKIKGIRNSFAG